MNPKQAIENLRLLGWSDQRIASEAGTTTTNVWRIRTTERDTAFLLGSELIAIAKREQAKARKAAA